MTDLPAHIRVGAVTYRVLAMSADTSRATGQDGACDSCGRIIWINEDLNPDDRARIFLHEVMHAAWNMGALDDTAPEEKAILVLANQLSAIWRDNPGFVAFMNGALSIDMD